MNDAEKRVSGFLAPYGEEIRTFAQALRNYLKQETDPAYELAGMSAQSFNIGYGFTTRAWDCFCAIIVYRKHLNLSLPSGAFLTDPEGLMHGTGARVRHLKIRELKDVQTAAARRLLLEAREHALELVEDGGSDHQGVMTVIKTGKKTK